MALSRRSTRPRFTLILLVLASVTAITLGFRGGEGGWLTSVKNGATDAFAPVQSATLAVVRPIGSFFEGAAGYGSLQAENAHLRARLTQLQAQSAQASDLQRQLSALEGLDHLSFAANIPKVTADVVGLSPSNFQDTVELDKGTASGIAVGMPVISGSGLVGRVVAASTSRATVLMVTDPSSNIGVRFGPKGSLALASGQGSGAPLRISYVDPGTKLATGELMMTSGGAGDLFPPGIPVGQVATHAQAPGALSEDVTLAPMVALDRLQYVDVLRWAPTSGNPTGGGRKAP